MPFQSFYGEQVDTTAPRAPLELGGFEPLLPVWNSSELAGPVELVVNLDYDTTERQDFLRKLLGSAAETAPEHGPGVRRSTLTGTLWYSAAWLD
jgi:hypothetical protein